MISLDPIQAPQASAIPDIDRRGVLRTLGLAGLGVLASSLPSEAFTSQAAPKVAVPTSSATSGTASYGSCLSDLPEEWVASHGRQAIDYVRYLKRLNLQRISPEQVLTSHAQSKSNVWNSLPPKVWWNRIGYTLKVVDRIAREMNIGQVEVISAYRCPAYNAQCRGARAGSYHQANVAADVKFPVRPSKVAATARELRDLGLFRGGVGGYWNFTHIDCRGQNMDW